MPKLFLFQFEKGMTNISSTISLHDGTLEKEVKNLLNEPLPETLEDRVEDCTNKVTNKIDFLGNACAYIWRICEQWNHRMDQVEASMN